MNTPLSKSAIPRGIVAPGHGSRMACLRLASVLLLLPGAVPSALAAFVDVYPSGPLGLAIPDGSAVGLAHEQVVAGLAGPITSVSVFLEISASGPDPMFNGDLYVTLTHSTGFSVLINRVGRRDGFLAGYGDSGFAVTLADSAAADIHSYRLTLNGSHFLPLGDGGTPIGLTGSWQPDGRAADPAVVTEGTVRSAGMSVFEGLNPNGAWTLFVADLSPGGTARLDRWILELTTVPEPGAAAAVAGAALVLWTIGRRWRR